MARISEVLTAKAVATRWEASAKLRKPYLFEGLFPARKKLGLELSWIKGARKAPVAMQLSSFDAKVIPLSRGTFEKTSAEMPFFKNSLNVNEKQRQELHMINESYQEAIKAVVSEIFDDALTLLEASDLVLEQFRASAVVNGAIAYESNGQTVNVDYGYEDWQKVTLGNNDKWTATATADPIAKLGELADLVAEKGGVRPSYVVMNTATLSALKKVTAVKDAIYVLGEGKITPSTKDVKNHIQDEAQLTVLVYDKGYMDEASGAFTKFVPDGKAVLIPEGDLGNTWFGTTPEESDLMTAKSASVSIVDTGKAVTTYHGDDPVVSTTKVSMIALPSFEQAGSCVTITAY